MKASGKRALTVVMALAVVTGARAQAPTVPSDDIVVQGQRLTRQEALTRAQGFVRTLGVVQGDRSLARWVEPICPKVIGLSAEHGRIVMDRLQATIRTIGAPLAKGTCDTNLLVAFVSDGKQMVNIIDQKQSRRMAQVQGPERRALLESDAPIRWWYMIDLGSGDGTGLGSNAPPGVGGNSDTGAPMWDGIPTSQSYGSSLIRSPVIRMISAATILVDVNRAEGVPLTAVVDYAAFVGLAEVRARALPPLPSILNLFGAQPEEASGPNHVLTDWDRRFLVRLYTLPLNRLTSAQRNRLVNALLDEDGPDTAD